MLAGVGMRLPLDTVGDFFQKLGDLEATADEAPGLAAAVSDWLVAEDIVSGELTDCVLGGLGRRPGVCHGKALRDRADAHGFGQRCGPTGYASTSGARSTMAANPASVTRSAPAAEACSDSTTSASPSMIGTNGPLPTMRAPAAPDAA